MWSERLLGSLPGPDVPTQKLPLTVQGVKPVGGYGHRIAQGGQLNVEVTSSIAAALAATCRVVYDDGSLDTLTTNDFTTGALRATQSFKSVNRADNDGWVYDAVITSKPNVVPVQRGQCFGRMTVDPAFGGVLGYGYIYSGHDISQGQYDEPGPAGGHGAYRTITSADPAANADIVAQTAPTGVIWLLRSFTVQVVQGATQTPMPVLFIRGTGSVNLAMIPIAVTALGASTTTNCTWGVGLTPTAFIAVAASGQIVQALPVIYLRAGDDFLTGNVGMGANTDLGAANYQVEEWVMPN